jgi:hypothetical protein
VHHRALRRYCGFYPDGGTGRNVVGFTGVLQGLVLCKGNQYLRAVLVRYPGLDPDVGPGRNVVGFIRASSIIILKDSALQGKPVLELSTCEASSR